MIAGLELRRSLVPLVPVVLALTGSSSHRSPRNGRMIRTTRTVSSSCRWPVAGRLRRVARDAVTSDRRGFILLGTAGVLYVAGLLAAELFTMRVSFVLAVAGILFTLEGERRFRVMGFPVLFLLAMVPLPYVFYYKLTFPLQLESSRLAAGFLSGMGMPLVREGNMIHLEGYSLEVVTACSGLRSIMTLGTLSLFMLDFLRLAPWLRVVFMLLSIPIAVAANVGRLVLTAGIAAIQGPDAAESFLHELSGLVVFVFGMAAIVAAGKALEWTTRARKS
jgi:exosortase